METSKRSAKVLTELTLHRLGWEEIDSQSFPQLNPKFKE